MGYRTKDTGTRSTLASHKLFGKLSSHATATVLRMLVPVVDPAGGGIAEIGSGFVFVAGLDFLSFVVGVEVTAMLCVTVAVACCGKAFAVVVNDHRTVDDFITSVPIYVGNTEVVVSFSEPWAARFVVEPPPTLHQFVGFRIHIVGNHLVARVDAACQKDARMAAVQVRRTEKELVGAVAVTVAPCGVQVRFAILQPFKWEILTARIHNLLAQRRQQQNEFKQNAEAEAKDVTISPADEDFLNKALRFVEKNMDNSEYSVDELSDDMAMSRATLFRKMRSVIGMSPTDFIRNTRLKRAAQLITEGRLSVTEIAYSVGYSSPGHFTKSFKKEFGVLPTQYHKT